MAPIILNVSVVDLDVPWQTVHWSPTQLPPGSSLEEATGTIQWTPTEAQGPGLFALGFTASDDAACNGSQVATSFFITVNEVNKPPVWIPQPDIDIPLDTPQAIQLFASDPDLPVQTLNYEITGLPPGLDFEANSLRIVGSANTPGLYPVTVIISDSETPPLSATNQFTMRVDGSTGLRLSLQPWDGAMRLVFSGVAGVTYTVEYTDSFSPVDWQLFKELSGEQVNTVEIPGPSGGASFRFYRVRWTP